MNSHPMMKCGCAAQGVMTAKAGVKFDTPIPSCLIHDCQEIADSAPDLTGRMAECAYRPAGHSLQPSDPEKLAFFEYRGPGSRWATDVCKCGLSRKPHDEHGGKIPARKYALVMKGCAGFTPRGPHQYDLHYCGCHGWD